MITFDGLGLHPSLVQATADLGYTNPTSIQEQAIPILLQGITDFVGLAQTGTGKTAAFSLPLLHLLDHNTRTPQALVVCPTRELCMQIVVEIGHFKKYLPNVHTVAVYGGTSIGAQIRELRQGVQIVVATPGRLIDLIERKAINLDEIHYVVLDEADEMLNMGFKDDIEFILQNTPQRQSTWLFSATMPDEIRRVSQRYMTNPAEVTVGKVNSGNRNIDHQYYVTAAHNRYETLKRLIDFNPEMYGLIFTRTKHDAQAIAEKLTREGYDIDALHGDLSQNQRDKVMGEFRERTLQLLIATDVAARGIDVKDITHVINYELPDDPEVYTHRSGRTGRAGSTGICMSIIHSRETNKLRHIERIVQAPFQRVEIPSGSDVCRKQFNTMMDKLLQIDITSGAYAAYLPLLQEKFADVSKEEVLQRLAASEFDRFLRYYANAEDLNVREPARRNGADRFGQHFDDRRGGQRPERNRARRGGGDRFEGYSDGGNYTRLFMNLGLKDGFYKASFVQFILDMSDLPKSVLGRIDMKDMNSFVEVDGTVAPQMIQALDGKKYKGRRLRVHDENRR